MQQCSEANLFMARRMFVMEIVVESFDNTIQELTQNVEVHDLYLFFNRFVVGLPKNNIMKSILSDFMLSDVYG